jgi:hypothetical protein
MTQSEAPRATRYEVRVEDGPPRGDLYELEQKTYYQVVDVTSNEVLMTFEGLMEASLSRDNGLWDDYCFTGVCEVRLAPDEGSVVVQYYDGREEVMPLPPPSTPTASPSDEPPRGDPAEPEEPAPAP